MKNANRTLLLVVICFGIAAIIIVLAATKIYDETRELTTPLVPGQQKTP